MTRAPFLVLFGRAALHLCRRWWQYALLILATFGIESALYLLWPGENTLQIGEMLFPPVLVAITYALVGKDEGVLVAPFRRALQRWWLVVIVDFLANVAVAYAFASFATRDAVSGIALLAVNVSLIYADVYVVLEEPADALLLLRSVGRSTFTAWSGLDSIGRSITLMALQLAPILLSQVVAHRLELAHVQLASFWAQLPVGILLVPPLSAITAFVYLDATGHEAKRTCGE